MTRVASRDGKHRQRASTRVGGVPAGLQKAIHAHRAGHLEHAEWLYRRVLDGTPGQPDALHFLGVLCHQRGRSGEGIALIRAALQSTPRHADAHNNLGNLHKECGSLGEAEACYRHALNCCPQHADAWSNLAIVLEAQQRPQEAFDAYTQLLVHAPQLGRAHYLMGVHLRNHVTTIADVEQAIVCFRNAMRCDSRNVRALEALGVALYMLGRREEAIGVYRDWLAREPGNPVPRHMLASCGGETAPMRADDAYVRKVFDSFADSFDEQLLNNLDYRAPQALAEALNLVLDARAGLLDVLDAGCGTGLCGPLIRSYARQLTGVDLSPGMIEKARARGGYDVLVVAELTAYLRARTAAWDVVICADTLVYFGDLVEVLSAACSTLRAGGWFAFTLEALADDEDRSELSPSGRYRHSRRYLERVLPAAGFSVVTMERAALRKEVGKPVPGWVVLACKIDVRNPG